jgi:hypothetical protein
MSKQAIELVEMLATYPQWMQDAEKRMMIEKMAKRITLEVKRDDRQCIDNVK